MQTNAIYYKNDEQNLKNISEGKKIKHYNFL